MAGVDWDIIFWDLRFKTKIYKYLEEHWPYIWKSMVNSTFTLEAPGDVNRLPKRYLETPGDVKRLPKRYLECWMSRGRAIPINYYLLLLIITYYWLLLPWAMYWSIMMENDNTRRDQIDICNMAHETNKAMSDQSNTLWLAGGEGDQGSTTFFYRHFFFLVIKGKCFYSCTSFPITYMRSTGMRISR